ncbi:ATPase domain-containing protein [Rhizobium phage RHph_TM30]|uniref:ATPase domain-containing protein n=2 Tax=Cuauhnahuacvirus TaxID=3044696 RepID=A0A7S5UXT7_9CAUD|nr:ATPase domain-containing protein [Rhizobium phage RHph_TM30]YP_010671422.1 ATPase domain-containing protein [Rhizobium phage RHph_Y65]QIG71380.1 ATPase domain-containing protein [Rhizobium phage RHph_TM30]QIG72106.1 ATPase domain-containing protein [Rhizobium phage RHph_TM2_3B]QIG72831.1 ATPase domain-containing protein [Rhizobium phage RHph_Y65]
MSINSRDYAPLLSYAKMLTSRLSTIPDVTMIGNFAKTPPNLNVFQIKPTLIRFGTDLLIQGDKSDIVLGSNYLAAHPKDEYEILEYEDPSIAARRFESTWGMTLEEYDDHVKVLNTQVATVNNESYVLDEETKAKMSDASDFLTRWIRMFSSKTNKAPLLVGHSGISKSAFVKEVISRLDAQSTEWGYRLVDIRAAYLDKTDLMGYISVESFKGNDVWTDSPKIEFLTSTSEFIKECRKFVTTTPRDDDNGEMWDIVKEYSKTPVLFFDEINRAPAYIQAQVMIIINQHRLNDYSLDLAPKIAAANVPIDMEDLDDTQKELIKYVLQDEITDKAIIDRFIPIEIKGKDKSVIDATYSYLTRRYATSGASMDLLESVYKKGKPLHDITTIDKYGKFRSHRGLEFVCTYLSGCEGAKEKPMLSVIKSLIGENATDDYVSYLAEKFKTTKENLSKKIFDLNESTSKFTAHCIKFNIPTMLLGRMGIGKTAKINAATKELDADVINIDLSSRDRTDISGFPSQYSFAQYIFSKGGQNDDLTTSSAFRQFEAQLVNNPNVPKKTTGFVGSGTLTRRLDEARASGKKLVIVFDEINRASPIVQSAVFEAISDKRFMGVSLEGIDYSVVSAGNWEDPNESSGNYQVTPLDTATLHRFASRVIDKMTEDDIGEMRDFIKTTYPNTYSALNMGQMSNNDIVQLLNTSSDEDDNAEPGTEWARPSFSMRTFQSLNEILDMYKFVWTQEMTVDESDDIVKVLESPNYILRDRAGEEVTLRTSGIKKYFPSLVVEDFIAKAAQMLGDDNVSVLDKSMILAELQYNEVTAYQSLEKAVRGVIPGSMLKHMGSGLRVYYTDLSKASVGAVDLDQLVMELSDNEIRKVLNKMISRSEASKTNDVIKSAIIALGQANEISVDYINKILSLYKSVVPTSTISLVDILNQIPDENIVSGGSEIVFNFIDLAAFPERDVILQSGSVSVGTPVSTNPTDYKFLGYLKVPLEFGSVNLGSKYEKDQRLYIRNIIPNCFRIICNADALQAYYRYEFTISDAFWKIDTIKPSTKRFEYNVEYVAKIKGVSFRMKIDNIRHPVAHKDGDLTKPLTKDTIIQRDTTVLSGMLATQAVVSDSSVSNLTKNLSDVLTDDDITIIKSTVMKKKADTAKMSLTNDYMQLILVGWRKVEPKFSF